MIKSFADKETERLFRGRKSRAVPEQIRERALAKLVSIDIADDLEELRHPPGNRLERLRGDREGQWSIRINQQFRICFAFEDNDAYDIEMRYSRKLWIEDFPRDVVYLPFEQSNGIADAPTSAERVHRCTAYNTIRPHASSSSCSI